MDYQEVTLLSGLLVKTKKTENKPITYKIGEELMNLIERVRRSEKTVKPGEGR